MGGKLATVYQLAVALKSRLLRAFVRLIALAIQAWRWADSLDIPLSPLQWILLFYAVFGLVYLPSTPVFEANDELWHFGYIQHIRETGNLPVQVFDGVDTPYQQHGSQPPLYYLIASLLTSPLSIDDVESYRLLNPHVTSDKPDSFGNKNLTLRDMSQSMIHGAGLVIVFLRAFGLALGAGTIVFVYRIGELISPQRPTVAFVAAAITGLNPMFIFVSASVNNDTLAMVLNGALILLLLRTLRDGFRMRYTLVIALLFALTSLTKLTSLILLPVLLSAALFVQRKTRNRRGMLAFVYLLALSWLLIAGWWYLRNLQLYGEPFGIIMMSNIAGPRGVTFDLVDLFADFQLFRMSYWGLFGALNIQLTSVFYVLLDLMTFLSIVGLVFLILQLLAISDFAYARYELAHLVTLLSAFLITGLGVIIWSTMTRAAEGRIVFPLIAVTSPLLAVGLVEIVWWIVFSLRPPNLEFVRAGDAVPKELLHDTMVWQLRILGIVALFAPLTVIASQYSAPQPLPDVPEKAQRVYAEFGDVALVAYERVDRRYSTGDRVRLKLYWQVLQQSAEDKSVLLMLVDDNQQVIGSYTTYPGAGSLRTTRWQPGAIYPDEYLINIHESAYGRYPFDLHIEWADFQNDLRILPRNSEGEDIEPVLLDIGAVVTLRFQSAASDFNEIPTDMQPKFDDAIILESFQLDLELNEIILSWKAETAPTENYTVFAHMLDENGNILTQADTSPRLPTKYWRWGEAYTTYHRFPAGFSMIDHKVIVGLYINDGLTFPKAEYVKTLTAEEISPIENDEINVDAGQAATLETGPEIDPFSETEEVEVYLDSFTIPWDIASEVIALTPTPEPTAESSEDAPALENRQDDKTHEHTAVADG
ncbi:MAG: glycosyltransferase family 39 protein [Chloroflexi bacterium]|nr:glycosyltransferase family 39 protein [Chloroflexota bacterium]